jgi:hypothetical protein
VLRRISTRWLLVALGAAGVLAPGGFSQLLPGLPLSVAGLLAAAGVVYASLALPSLRWDRARWLAVAFSIGLGLKLIAAATSPPLGLVARYRVGPASSGVVERSTDFARLDGATRIDGALDLRAAQFPVYFFNDAARFNFGPDVQPARDQLPFSVGWEGWLLVPSDGQRRFVVESTGPVAVSIDDASLPGGDARLTLSAGVHTLHVAYTRPEARVPWLRVSWERTPGGPLEALGGADVRRQPSSAGIEVSTWLGRAADAAIAGAIAAWVVLGLVVTRTPGRTRAALGGVPLVFLAHGMLLHAPLADRATILSGLDDWLIYESSARDILLNGLLMDGGQGHAPPFYGQPLYPYALALAHWLTGEGLFGPLALQFAALGAVVLGAAVLARRAFGSRLDGMAALALVWALVGLEPEHFKVARQLFNENLYMPLVMASLIAVVGLARRSAPPARWRALLVGCLLGVTAISRSQFLLFVPFALLVLLAAWRARGMPALGLIVVGTLLAVTPVTARNWIVSGQFVPITSSGGASLLEFHRPPPGLLDQTALQTDPLFNALHLDTQTRTVVAFARADPRGYLMTLLPLAAHSLGLQGRNDPGMYWPLFVTVLLYVASFGLRQTRRLHVWPIHAFVATHLAVLMLFEADTYGYRLVVPMYAPMAAVAAQAPLWAIRRLLRARPAAALRSGHPARATRYAQLGWGLVLVSAVAWQARSLVDVWPEREPALLGLGGAAAQAAVVADSVSASAIYVASIDGTPRRFGAGSLPGLRYPWFKWFDPARSLPLPPASSTAVYQLAELRGQSVPGDLVSCLGAPGPEGTVSVTADEARQRCAASLLEQAPIGASFDGLARIDALQVASAVAAGESLDARLVWQPLLAHPEPQQFSLQLDDPSLGDGTQWGNGTQEVYPAREWQPDEAVLSRVPISTEATALPQEYRLTLGIGPTRPNAPPATAVWRGSRTDRLPVASVSLLPGSSAASQALPADMRRIDGAPLVDGGLELIGARPLPPELAIGSPLRIGLLWQVTRDAPEARQVKVRLVRDDGEVLQESALPVLGGKVAPAALRAGNVVRDEQMLVGDARLPAERLAVEVNVEDERIRLGSIQMTTRAHVFSDAAVEPEAAFDGSMLLLADALEPGQAHTGDKVTLKLRWRAAAPMDRAYKVFVHVLDPSGQQVVAQRDAEPQDGKAPTTSWVAGEVLEDEYTVALPAALPSGDYPLEVGVYDPRSGERLSLANGDNRLLLAGRLRVR